MRLGRVGSRKVGSMLADLDVYAGWLATVGGDYIRNRSISKSTMEERAALTHSCFTPTVQHFPGGLEAILLLR